MTEQRLPENVRAKLRAIGIKNPSADVELHADLVDVFQRMGNNPPDQVNIAVMWAFHADLVRQGQRYAEAKTEYERVLGAAVIRYRAAGEKSAAVAQQRAEAEDDGVYVSHLAYRVAERLEIAARKALDILSASNDNWRTQEANMRKADEHLARGAVT